MTQYHVTLIMVACLLMLTARCDTARLCDTQLVHATFLACGMAKRSSLPPLFFPRHSDDDNMLPSSDVISFAKRLENQEYRTSVEHLAHNIHRLLQLTNTLYQGQVVDEEDSDRRHHRYTRGADHHIIDKCCRTFCTLDDLADLC